MLFQFKLLPLEEVTPWGPGTPSLSWFSLSLGCYWWEVGGQQLFRSSQAWIDHWASQYPKLLTDLPYEDYQVSRPWEDLLDHLPAILDPVPEDLLHRAQDTQKWESLQKTAFAWSEAQSNDALRDLPYTAFRWWFERTWDAGYLRCPPKIWLWTQGDTFHIRWDNRDVIDDGLPVWEATYGELTMPVAESVEEAKSFNERLMSQMAKRVNAVVAGAIRPDIKINLAHLVYEQSDRATWLENALTLGRVEEDWDKVREALTTLEQICYNNDVEGL